MEHTDRQDFLSCVCVRIYIIWNVALTTILSGQTVDAVIGFSVTANKTAQGVGSEAASQTTLGVDVANVKLNGSVVLGSDKAVGGRAGKVSALSVCFYISHSRQTSTNHLRGMYKSTSWPSEFSIVQQKRRSPCCRPRQGKFCVSIPLSHLYWLVPYSPAPLDPTTQFPLAWYPLDYSVLYKTKQSHEE